MIGERWISFLYAGSGGFVPLWIGGMFYVDLLVVALTARPLALVV